MKDLKIKFTLFFFFATILLPTYGQTYNEIITNAYSCAFLENDYNKAARFFEKAFEKGKPKSADLYYAAGNSLKIDSVEKFKNYLSLAVEYGYSNYEFLSKRENYKTYFTKKEWNSLLDKAKENYSLFEKDYQKIKKSLEGYYVPEKKISGKIDLRNDTLKIKYQGQRNTCSVFAATALVEYLIWKKFGKAVDLSEAYNYWAAKTYALNNDYLKESYTSVDGLAGYLAMEAYKYGSMLESEWKYETTNWLANKDKRCKKIDGNYIKECFTGVPPDGSEKAEYVAEPVFIDRENIGQYILQEKNPVLMNIFWYYDAVDNKTGELIVPEDAAARKGGHVILLVGYDSEKRNFIFQNAWGTKWGDKGFGSIPEEYIQNYFEVAETFPYGTDSSEDEKLEMIKASMGISAKLVN
jgi:C1A family cysteine protease